MTDTDRIDWLEKNPFTINNDLCVLPISLIIPKATIIRRTVRKAIDEAIRRTATKVKKEK